MLNEQGVRELAYLVNVDAITPMDADRLECAHIGGWNCVVGKGEFKVGDPAVYFEIDSKLPEVEPFTQMEFLKSKEYKVKSQKIRGVVSQGLLMPVSAFGWHIEYGCFGWEDIGYAFLGTAVAGLEQEPYAVDDENKAHTTQGESRFLTAKLGVTYAVTEDNVRKASVDKYKLMAQRRPNVFKKPIVRWFMRREWGKKLMFAFFGKKKEKKKEWPVGKFPGVSKTDQERVENMTWVLDEGYKFIRTQKCDGTSATYILERKGHKKFEFYVCSRNVRMVKPDQECFYGQDNYYWDMAIKYDIERKMKSYMMLNPELTFVCWQGEICGPSIQGNPQHLKEPHLFCFHWTDDTGRWDIRKAQAQWGALNMETVPIEEEDYTLPTDFEELKETADGNYDPSVCEGQDNCPREGFVYYRVGNPTFSFKNVSRKYLLKRNI